MDCFVCEKHRQGDAAQGGVLFEDDLLYVGHVHALEGPTAYRGHLVVEPNRHAPGLGDLTDEVRRDTGGALGRRASEVAGRPAGGSGRDAGPRRSAPSLLSRHLPPDQLTRT